ncbi:MAG: hypothetical protein QOK16_914 [Solirubrobacteraceae bacterium]|jgi:hypothetical protein|nr:hypothetical protein [Solirubrobacteraceae bacterium]
MGIAKASDGDARPLRSDPRLRTNGRSRRRRALLTICSLLMTAAIATPAVAAVRRPPANATWQYQLQGAIDVDYPAKVFDIDGLTTPASTVARLHRAGRYVVCYISAGSYENWRSDAKRFPAAVLGKRNGWPGERWLDIRRLAVLAPIMRARMDVCKAKGFDAVEPDNVDGYTNSTGFPLSAADQLAYNRFLAGAAHARGLAVGLKNDLEQVRVLARRFDFAVVEQCFEFGECGRLAPFRRVRKPVFDVEYRGARASFCPRAARLGINALLKRVDLRAPAWQCPSR